MDPTEEDTSAKIDALFRLLNDGADRIKALQKQENAVLVLGNTGSGITTFTTWITGSYARLNSRRDPDNLGEYYIHDYNHGETKKSHFVSETIFPGIMFSRGTAFYDFPGFMSTKGAVQDIATTHFTKLIVGNARNVKIIFLVSYASITNTESRHHFKDLMINVMKMMDNFNALKNSIILVVSKVTVGQNYSYNDIISSIVLSLRNTRAELQNEINNNVNVMSNTRSIEFLDAITRQSGIAYPYLQLFRSPHEEGDLNRINMMEDNKQRVITALERLPYAPKNEFDFLYFVPEQSLAGIGILLDEVHRHILAGVKEFGQEVQKVLSNRQSQIFDTLQLHSETILAYEALNEVKEAANKQDTPEICVRKIVFSSIISCKGNSHMGLMKALKYAGYSAFLYSFSGFPVYKSIKCADGLDNALEYLEKSRKWYQFLVELYGNALSTFEVQKNLINNQCTNLTRFVFNAPITNNSSDILEEYVKQCDPQNKYEYKNIIIDEPKFNALYNLLNLTMGHKLEASCKSDLLLIKAQYLRIGDIGRQLKQICPGITPKSIHVFVAQTLFLDEDLTINGETWLSILAQKWEVRSESGTDRQIRLLGDSAKAHNQSKAPDGIEHKPVIINGTMMNGTEQDGEPGHPGLPGLSGKNGGHFFGVGDTFINFQRLFTSSIGGDGGPAQEGGNGGKGQDGRNAYNDLPDIWAPFPKESPTFTTIQDPGYILFVRISWKEDMTLEGKRGAGGGRGGDGGVAGLGAYPGTLTLIPLSYSDEVKFNIKANRGINGTGNKAGIGGVGGWNGQHCKIHIEYASIENPKTPDYLGGLGSHLPYWTNTSVPGFEGAGQEGLPGIDNNNANGLEIPAPTEFTNSEKALIVNDYKAFLRDSIYRSPRESFLRKYLSVIENRTIVISQDDVTPIPTSTSTTHATTNNNNNHPVTLKYTNLQSAAHNLESPINIAMNLVVDFFIPLKLIYPTIVTNSKLIKSRIESMFEKSASSQSNPYSTSTTTKLDEFNVNGAIAFADFLIRCVTKVKPFDSTSKPIDVPEVRSTTLNIIAEFETVLSHLACKLNLSDLSIEFDPVSLISALDQKLISRDYQNLTKVLFQSISQNADLDYANFENDMRPRIDQELVTRDEHKQQLQ